jgi:hypothetical protein
VNAHETVGQDAAAEEASELALDEARHRALARPCASEEALELAPDDAIEDAFLGAASRVARLAATTAMGMGGRRCAAVHSIEPLPASYRAPSASSTLDRTRFIASEAR